jgi:hypothetical protein
LTLEPNLLIRNYPQDLISKQFDRAKSKERKGLIFQQRKSKNIKDNKVRLIFTHGAANPPFTVGLERGKSYCPGMSKPNQWVIEYKCAASSPKTCCQ